MLLGVNAASFYEIGRKAEVYSAASDLERA